MKSRNAILAVTAALFAGSSACVSVETPDTNVKVGITSVELPGRGHDGANDAPYAKPLRKVTGQQREVTEQLAKRDWSELAKESSDWIRYTRELSGYATTTDDPNLFRDCCERIIAGAESIRQAALRRDAATAQQALAACDPPLNQLCGRFPLTQVPRQTAVASPPAAAPPSAQPSAPVQPAPAAPRRPLVP